MRLGECSLLQIGWITFMEDLGLGFNHGVLLVGRYFLCWLEFTSKYFNFSKLCVWNTRFLNICI